MLRCVKNGKYRYVDLVPVIMLTAEGLGSTTDICLWARAREHSELNRKSGDKGVSCKTTVRSWLVEASLLQEVRGSGQGRWV